MIISDDIPLAGRVVRDVIAMSRVLFSMISKDIPTAGEIIRDEEGLGTSQPV